MSTDRNLKLWLDDLRTTYEPQTQGHLSTLHGDCCLGRLCKVAIADGLKVRVRLVYKRGPGTGTTHYSYDGHTSDPPAAVDQWLGHVRYALNYSTLIDLNDDEGCTFAEIAARIESDLSGDCA